MTKNILLATSAAIALAATAQAGEVMSPKSPIMPPAPECRLQWFLGASGGYLLDAEEDMYHLQFGAKKQCDQHSHALYLELGYVSGDDSFIDDALNNPNDPSDRLTTDTEIIPLTLNYKYSQNINERLEWYLGAGAGVAFVNNDTNTFGDDTLSYLDDAETVFYAQAFAGLTYSFNSSIEAFGGVRYIYMDEPKASSIDDDFLVELGLRYNF